MVIWLLVLGRGSWGGFLFRLCSWCNRIRLWVGWRRFRLRGIIRISFVGRGSRIFTGWIRLPWRLSWGILAIMRELMMLLSHTTSQTSSQQPQSMRSESGTPKIANNSCESRFPAFSASASFSCTTANPSSPVGATAKSAPSSLNPASFST